MLDFKFAWSQNAPDPVWWGDTQAEPIECCWHERIFLSVKLTSQRASAWIPGPRVLRDQCRARFTQDAENAVSQHYAGFGQLIQWPGCFTLNTNTTLDFDTPVWNLAKLINLALWKCPNANRKQVIVACVGFCCHNFEGYLTMMCSAQRG